MPKTILEKINLSIILIVIFVAAITTIIIVFVFYFDNFGLTLSTNSKTDWGVFGDFVGGTLNPLLSFLGLIALLFTIALQSKELALSKEELKLTREELARSASAQEEINKTQARQQFENTFFALLDQHNKLLEKLTEIPPPTPYARQSSTGLYHTDYHKNISILGDSFMSVRDYTNLSDAKLAIKKK